MVTVQLLVAAIMLSPTVFIDQGIYMLSRSELALLIILGAVHTGLALNLYLEGLRLTPAQHAVIIQYLEPANAFLYVALLFEIPDLISFLGCMLIIPANIILILGGCFHH